MLNNKILTTVAIYAKNIQLKLELMIIQSKGSSSQYTKFSITTLEIFEQASPKD